MIFPGTDGLVAWESVGQSSSWVLGLQVGFWEEWAEESPSVESSWVRMGWFLLRVCSLAGHLEFDPNLPPVLLPSIPGCSWLESKSASCRLGWALRWALGAGPHLTCQTPFTNPFPTTPPCSFACVIFTPFPVSLTLPVAEDLGETPVLQGLKGQARDQEWGPAAENGVSAGRG